MISQPRTTTPHPIKAMSAYFTISFPIGKVGFEDIITRFCFWAFLAFSARLNGIAWPAYGRTQTTGRTVRLLRQRIPCVLQKIGMQPGNLYARAAQELRPG